MASMPTKIVLKSTTSMSLNDRFSHLPKVQSPQQHNTRAKMAASTNSSQANRRLAQQMGNRPTVQAALKKGMSGGDVKQRLGSPNKGSVKARLTLPPRGRGRGSIFTRSPQRGGLRTLRGARTTVRGRGVGYKIRGGRVQRAGASGGRGGARGRGVGTRGAGPGSPVRGGGRGRGVGRGGMRGVGRGGMRGVGRGGMRGQGGRGRGRGGTPRSREQLDTDLDTYMSKSRAHLDAELDAYMASLD